MTREKLLTGIGARILLLFAASLAGCDLPYKEKGPILHERAVVEDAIYAPGASGTGIGPSIGLNLNIGLAVTSIDVDPSYAVVFKCQHGKFVVNSEATWKSVSKGDTVDIAYQEVFDVNSKGRRLTGYHFISAAKVTP